MKEDQIEFGKFLLRYLNVNINKEEIKWDFVHQAFEDEKKGKILPSFIKPQIQINRPGLMYISWVIAQHYGFDSLIVQEGKGRKRELTRARQVCHYIALTLFKYTQSEVGRFFNKDHATVLYSRNRVEKDFLTDKNYKAEVEQLKTKFKQYINGNNESTSTGGSTEEISAIS